MARMLPSIAVLFVCVLGSSQASGALIQMMSGNGSPGGPDRLVSMLSGPHDLDFPADFSDPFLAYPSHFAAARNGASARIVDPTRTVWLDSLPLNSNARWISSVTNSFETGNSTLFAVPFNNPGTGFLRAFLNLEYAVDNKLGGGVNRGVFVNEVSLPGTLMPLGSESAAFSEGNFYSSDNIASLINPGENNLYLYNSNVWSPSRRGRASGIIFNGEVSIDPFQAPFSPGNEHVLTRATHPDEKDRYAIDFAGGKVDVVASRGGIAYRGLDRDGYGRYVVIDHGMDPLDSGQRLLTLYAHLDTIADSIDVSVHSANGANGTPVNVGEVLGVEGNTGRVFGPTGVHIHFGLYTGQINEPSSWQSVPFGGDYGELRIAHENNPVFRSYSTLQLQEVGTTGVRQFRSDNDQDNRLFRSGTLSPGETRGHVFTVNPRMELLDFRLVWPGSELELSIFDSSGDLVSRFSETDGIIEGALSSPAPGLWSFEIAAVDVSPSGEPYSFEVSATPVPETGSLSLMLLGVVLCLHFYLFPRGRTK